MGPLPALLLLLAGTDSADPGARRVCHAPEAQLGSHFKKPKVCRTQAEWDAIEEARRGAALTTKAPQPESWERTRPQ
jgi:hypothetical protein